MGLFNIFKSKKSKQTRPIQLSTFNGFDYNFNLENSLPKIKITPYSKKISIALFLKSIKLSNEEIELVLSSTNNIIIPLVNILENKYFDIAYPLYKNTEISKNILQLKIILQDYEDIDKLLTNMLIESISTYYGIETLNRKDSNSIEYYLSQLNSLNTNTIDGFPILIKKDIASCIAVYHISTNITLNELAVNILKNIESEYNNKNIYVKNIVKYIDTKQLLNLIIYNIKNLYSNKLSISFLLKSENKIDTTNFHNLPFDIANLNQCKHDSDCYYIGKIYYDKCLNDINSLNAYIIKASELINDALTIIDINNINFNYSDNGYTRLKYVPLTRTGKASKYPFELFFSTYRTRKNEYGYYEDLEVVGSLSYYKDGTIGKAEFTTWKPKKGYTIALATKNNKLVVNRIFKHIDMEKKVIYKYEKQTTKSIELSEGRDEDGISY